MNARRSAIAALLALVAVLSGSVVALAANRFVDVPESNVFHDDIAWLADLGITKGCNPPTNDQFCPNDPVSRGQMAAFMHRFGDATVERTIVIDQFGFFPISDNGDYIDYDYNAVGTFGRVAPDDPLGTSVPVPDGATITEFSVTFCDTNLTDQTALLVRRPDPAPTGAFAETLAEVTSAGSDCAVTVTTPSITNGTVDARNYSYALEVRSGSGGSGFVRRATVTYEEPLIP